MIDRAQGPMRAVGPMQIARLRGLRYDPERLRRSGASGPRAVTAPPYDVIGEEEHRRLLEASPYNIAWLTLGSLPGGASSYEQRGRLLGQWLAEGVLVEDPEPCFYAYTVDYAAPGGAPEDETEAPRRRLLAWIALGRLHPLDEGIVLPHEKTFPKVVEDRYRLLDATRANLESILLLYSDPEGSIDRLLSEKCLGRPVLRVEARPGEFHAIYPCQDLAVFLRLSAFFRTQRPIIADGHHRYTTSLRFAREAGGPSARVPGRDWQMMTFANLYGDGLSILATHRLLKLRDGGTPRPEIEAEVLDLLASRLDVVDPADSQLRVETRERVLYLRFPDSLVESRSGVSRTAYALLHDVVLGEWLAQRLDPAIGIQYFKEGTGEEEALRRGEGDLLVRMPPVDRREFETVVQGGEVFPHKTTYFYPKLWSGLVLWSLQEPEPLALK